MSVTREGELLIKETTPPKREECHQGEGERERGGRGAMLSSVEDSTDVVDGLISCSVGMAPSQVTL
jgi:hypothetical protein